MPPRLPAIRAGALAAALTALTALAGCGSSGIQATAGSSSTPTPAISATTAAASSGQAGNAGDAASPASSSPAATYPAPQGSATAGNGKPAATATTADPFASFVPPTQSNCTPSTDTLPDGLYFGYISEIMDDGLDFDLACWFTGAPAAKAAAEDKQESPPPNDYYIRNTSTKVRSVPVGPSVDVALLPNLGSSNTIRATYQEWGIARGTGYQPPIWITVQNGKLTRVIEQFLP